MAPGWLSGLRPFHITDAGYRADVEGLERAAAEAAERARQPGASGDVQAVANAAAERAEAARANTPPEHRDSLVTCGAAAGAAAFQTAYLDGHGERLCAEAVKTSNIKIMKHLSKKIRIL